MYATAELYHHGIKGQQWGVRRWQNTDGSLTPEGYPHYGVNKPRKGYGPKKYQASDNSTKLDEMGVKAYGVRNDSIVSNNTRERAKQGAKKGAKAGAVVGAITTAAMVPTLAATMPVSVAAAAAYGAAAITSGTLAGTIYGTEIGTLIGARETQVGRQWMIKAGQNFDNVSYSDLRESYTTVKTNNLSNSTNSSSSNNQKGISVNIGSNKNNSTTIANKQTKSSNSNGVSVYVGSGESKKSTVASKQIYTDKKKNGISVNIG